VKTHQEIDQRSLALAGAVAAKVDADPGLLSKVRAVCNRWYELHHQAAVREWMLILQRPWDEIRNELLDDSEKGRRLRQNSPFCGILTPKERWTIYRRFSTNEKKGS